jgi:hypothetical protein
MGSAQRPQTDRVKFAVHLSEFYSASPEPDAQAGMIYPSAHQARTTPEDGGMAALATTTWNLGFLTILQDQAGFLGGYLVTNQWGRPLEFRLSTAVQPNRVQQILYGETLLPYVCGELIGKTLFEKTAAQAQAIVTDKQAALEVRRHLAVPVGYFKNGGHIKEPELLSHGSFPEDAGAIRELRDRLGSSFDFAEPFLRIREAVAEARKLGVTSRA